MPPTARATPTAAPQHRDLDAWMATQFALPAPAQRQSHRTELDRRFAAKTAGTVVLIVPGLFGDCVADQSVPFGDGLLRSRERSPREAYGAFSDLGLRDVRMVSLPGRASSAANGDRLAEAVTAAAADPAVDLIVIVGYSKGVADALHALAQLERERRLPPSVRALVSVAGAVLGTPLADAHRGVYDLVSPHLHLLDCSPSEGGELTSLSPAERRAWIAAHPVPSQVRTYSVVAIADPASMAWPLKWTWRELARVDPANDGQVLARDAVLPRSAVLAEVRADHWAVALPRERHPSAFWRWLSAPEPFPREALFRAILKTVVAQDGGPAVEP